MTVGTDCVDLATRYPSIYTVVNKDNPQSGTADIVTLKTFFYSSTTGIEYGAFDDLGSNSLKNNGNCDGANMSCDSARCCTFTAGVDFTAFEIQDGEYLALFCGGGGGMQAAVSGGNGNWSYNGLSWIDGGTHTFSSDDNNIVSIYGTTAAGGLSIPVAFHHLNKNMGGT